MSSGVSKVRAECEQHGAGEATIVAVSKKKSVADIQAAFDQGLRHFGENYVQEALPKLQALSELPIHWHFIGRLQKNKVKLVVGNFQLIHSVDSIELAVAIDKRAGQIGCRQDVLIQTNFSDELTKTGFSRHNFKQACEQIMALPHVRLCGVMDMPPLTTRPDYFSSYRKEVEQMTVDLNWKVQYWSLGTSSDYLPALKAGSNMIRVGTAIFGPR